MSLNYVYILTSGSSFGVPSGAYVALVKALMKDKEFKIYYNSTSRNYDLVGPCGPENYESIHLYMNGSYFELPSSSFVTAKKYPQTEMCILDIFMDSWAWTLS